MEAAGVCASAIGSIAFRVNRDEQHARPVVSRQCFPVFLRSCKLGQRGRADIWTVGESEKDQGPMMFQFVGSQLAAIGLAQRELRQRPRLRKQAHGLSLHSVEVAVVLQASGGGPQAQAHGAGGDQDVKGGAVEHGRGPIGGVGPEPAMIAVCFV